MSGAKLSVDEVWAKMKAQSMPQHSTAASSAAVASPSAKLPLVGTSRAPDPGTCTGSAAARAGTPSQPSAPASDEARVIENSMQVPAFDVELMGHQMALCMGQLKAESAGARRQALVDIKAILLSHNNPPPEDFLDEWVDVALYKLLLRRFEDSSEANRELAVTLFLDVLKAAPQAVLSVLPYVVPVLEERIQKVQSANMAPREPCEEVRLQMARLLTQLVTLSGKAMSAYAAEVLEAINIFCSDSFYEINIEACAMAVAVNGALGLRLQPASKALVAVLLPLCTHKRHKVRVAAIQAVRVTMFQGAHEMILEMVAFRDPNVVQIKAFYGDDLKVNFCGKLASDANMQVRLEFLRMLADWMINLRERMDHEHRLLPYVMSALIDESPIIQGEALELLEKLGAQWEKDHESDLKETVYYLPGEAHALGWIDDSVSAALRSFTYGGAVEGSGEAEGRRLFVLPGPCKQRPGLGTRLVVQANFGRAVHPLTAELTQSWQSAPRLQSAQLLRIYLVFVEDAVHQNLRLIIPAMIKAIQEPELAEVIADCCAICAAFTPPELMLKVLKPRATDEGVELRQKAAAVSLIGHIIRGAGARGAMDKHVDEILELLENNGFMRSEDSNARRSMLHVLSQLVSTCGPACKAEQERLLPFVLFVGASPLGRTSGSSPPLEQGLSSATSVPACISELAETEALADRLSRVCGYASTGEMIHALRPALMGHLHASSHDVALDLWVMCRLLLDQVVVTRASGPALTSEGRLLFAPDDELYRLSVDKALTSEQHSRASTPQAAAEGSEAVHGSCVAAADTHDGGTESWEAAAESSEAVHGSCVGAADTHDAGTESCKAAAECSEAAHGSCVAAADTHDAGTESCEAAAESSKVAHGISVAAAYTCKAAARISDDGASAASSLCHTMLSLVPVLCNQPQGAIPVLLCFERYLSKVPVGGEADCANSQLEGLPELLVKLLSLTDAPMLLGLRCLHMALLRRLCAPGLELRMGQLGKALAECLQAGIIPCRLQACHTTWLLALQLSKVPASASKVAAQQLTLAVIPPLSGLIDDPRDEVRSAAITPLELSLRLLKGAAVRDVECDEVVRQAIKHVQKVQDQSEEFKLQLEMMLQRLEADFHIYEAQQ